MMRNDEDVLQFVLSCARETLSVETRERERGINGIEQPKQKQKNLTSE